MKLGELKPKGRRHGDREAADLLQVTHSPKDYNVANHHALASPEGHSMAGAIHPRPPVTIVSVPAEF